MPIKSMHDLFLHELKDIYFAEKQLAKALPRLAKEAQDAHARQAFLDHEQETHEQLNRLDQVFMTIGQKPRGASCPGILGLMEERRDFVAEKPPKELLDMYNVGAGIKAERYEISAYESLIMLAYQLGFQEAADLLRMNLDEEQNMLERLQAVAEGQTEGVAFSDRNAAVGES